MTYSLSWLSGTFSRPTGTSWPDQKLKGRKRQRPKISLIRLPQWNLSLSREWPSVVRGPDLPSSVVRSQSQAPSVDVDFS